MTTWRSSTGELRKKSTHSRQEAVKSRIKTSSGPAGVSALESVQFKRASHICDSPRGRVQVETIGRPDGRILRYLQSLRAYRVPISPRVASDKVRRTNLCSLNLSLRFYGRVASDDALMRE